MDYSHLHPYQSRAIDFIHEKMKCALFIDMGLGKTVISLTAISQIPSRGKVLIIAPLQVANHVWREEASKWEHLKHLTFSLCTGNLAKRQAAINTEVDVYIINSESLKWLLEQNRHYWDIIIVDESSSFKSHKSKKFNALKRYTDQARYVVLLSGTPAPNGYLDLWSQFYLLDKGARLGRNITTYKMAYFRSTDYNQYKWEIQPFASEKINARISDIALSLSAEDYLNLPSKMYIDYHCDMPRNVKDAYETLKKDFMLALEENTITVPTAATMVNKLLQLCNGAIYDNDGNTHELDDFKIEFLEELVYTHPNENLLVAYNFISDLTRLQDSFPDAVVMGTSDDIVDRWNAGEIKMLLTQPSQSAYGLNLQAGGATIIWFGLTWSLSVYQQFNARLHRQGQKSAVKIIHLLAKGGMDEKVRKVLNMKGVTQKELLDYLRNK